MIAVAGEEDAVVKKEKHSSFVHVKNVEFLPTKVVKAKAPKRAPHYKPVYLQFRLGGQNPNVYFTRYQSPSAFRRAGAFIPKSLKYMQTYDYRLSPYMGCTKRCIYCFELVNSNVRKNEVRVKTNTVKYVRKVLSTLNERKAVLVDGYDCEEIEKKVKFLRSSLDVLLEFKVPVFVQTKSSLVLRDIDKLERLSECTELTTVAFSLTSFEEKHARIFEPYTTSPGERIKAMQKLSSRGILTGIILMPILPFISDTDRTLNRVFSEAATVGCSYIIPEPLRVTGVGPQRNNVFQVIKKYYPELLLKYERLYPRDPYGPEFGTRPRSRMYLCDLFRRIKAKGTKYKISTSFPIVRFENYKVS
jgi:DNA repair photolyase